MGSMSDTVSESWRRVAVLSPIGAGQQNAEAWVSKKGEILVSTFTNSKSGDWYQEVDYCFRVDGSLARAQETLNTFYASNGGVRVYKDLYFNSDGTAITSTVNVVDLKTQNPTTSTYQDRDLPIFKTITQLPFFGLIDTDGTIDNRMYPYP